MGKVHKNMVRGYYQQSVTPYEESLDVISYILGGHPVVGNAASAGGVFTLPTVGSRNYMSMIAQQYSSASYGNRTFGSGSKLPASPLSTFENLEAAPRMYVTPSKVDEEVLVMDEILVRSMPPGGRSSSSGRRAREESSNCRYDSQCQFAYGNEELHGRTHFSFKTKSEAQERKSSPDTILSTPGPKNGTVPQLQVAAAFDYYGIASQPASPIKPEPDHNMTCPTTFSDWFPLDDGIDCVLPHALTDKPSSRGEVDAHVSKILIGNIPRSRLPVFVEIFPDD